MGNGTSVGEDGVGWAPGMRSVCDVGNIDIENEDIALLEIGGAAIGSPSNVGLDVAGDGTAVGTGTSAATVRWPTGASAIGSSLDAGVGVVGDGIAVGTGTSVGENGAGWAEKVAASNGAVTG